MAGTDVEGARVNVGTAWDAGIYLAPEGTTLPTSTSDSLDAAFYTPGYISEDGIELGGDLSTESIGAWQSIVPVRKVISSRTLTIGMTLIESAPESLALFFDNDKPTETDGSFSMDISTTPKAAVYAVVVDVKDGTQFLRFAFPRAMLESAGSISITRTGAIAYPVTLEALDSEGVLGHVMRDAPIV